jgi:hypothetical protein
MISLSRVSNPHEDRRSGRGSDLRICSGWSDRCQDRETDDTRFETPQSGGVGSQFPRHLDRVRRAGSASCLIEWPQDQSCLGGHSLRFSAALVPAPIHARHVLLGSLPARRSPSAAGGDDPEPARQDHLSVRAGELVERVAHRLGLNVSPGHGRASRSPTRNSPLGVRLAAISTSAGAASMPAMSATRSAAIRAKRPAPHPQSSTRVPTPIRAWASTWPYTDVPQPLRPPRSAPSRLPWRRTAVPRAGRCRRPRCAPS